MIILLTSVLVAEQAHRAAALRAHGLKLELGTANSRIADAMSQFAESQAAASIAEREVRETTERSTTRKLVILEGQVAAAKVRQSSEPPI